MTRKELARRTFYDGAAWGVGEDDTVTEEMVSSRFEAWWNRHGEAFDFER